MDESVVTFRVPCPHCRTAVRVDPGDAVFFPPDHLEPATLLFACPHCQLHSMADIEEVTALRIHSRVATSSLARR